MFFVKYSFYNKCISKGLNFVKIKGIVLFECGVLIMYNKGLNGFINNFINEFCSINDVKAIVLAGSRSKEQFDDKSDYDFYIYSKNSIDAKIRNEILLKYCEYFELGNSYWELEDNGRFNNGIYFDIVYRNLKDFTDTIANVVENFNSYNGFTTCLWFNILNSKIIFDRDNIFKKMQKRFSVPYPKKLKESIIKRNIALLSDSVASYDKQIIKSIYRKDIINLNNRISAFFASYFDIIFAINELPNPGEKRIMEICQKECKILPNDFEKNINDLIYPINNDISQVEETVNTIICELKKIL